MPATRKFQSINMGADDGNTPFMKESQTRNEEGDQQVLLVDEHGNEYNPNVETLEFSPPGETVRVVTTTIKSFIGSGVLFLPKAFSNGGWAFSIGIMFFMAFVTQITILRLVECRKNNPGTYSQVGRKAYGWVAERAVDVCLVLSQAGFCCVYVVFVARNLLQLLNIDHCWLSGSYLWVIILLEFPVLVPLTWVRRIKTFAWTNIAANILIGGGLLGILLYSFVEWGKSDTPVSVHAFNSANFPLFLGTAVYSFEGIGMVVPIFESLSREGQQKFPKTLTYTLIVIASVYVIVGIFPYIYVEGVAGQTLSSAGSTLDLPRVWWAYMIIAAYCVALIFSFPLMLFPAVQIVEKGVASLLWRAKSNQTWKENTFRAFFVGVVLAFSYVGSSQLDNLVALVGCFCCTPLAFIFPAMFHYKLVGGSRFLQATNIIIALFGVGIFVFSTYQAISTWSLSDIDPCPHS